MTGIILGRTCSLSKEEIANKRAQRNSKHDPTIVRHENEPC